MNRFIAALADLCADRDNLLKEKWLLAPNRRVGYQWLEQTARAGHAVFNARPTTLRAFAVNLAAEEFTRGDRGYLTAGEADFLAELAWANISPLEKAYFAAVKTGPGFYAALTQAYSDLKLAGVGIDQIADRYVETGAKARTLRAFGREFEALLPTRNFVDYADVLSMAAAAIKNGVGYIAADALVILPEDLELSLLEKRLLAALPAGRVTQLPVDEPSTPPADGDPTTDVAMLRWVAHPSAAPAPPRDGTCDIFRAVGESNEVREVFRRCAAEGLALDEVEVLYSDEDPYLHLIYETAVRFFGVDGSEGELPVTFAAGIPARYARPGRALRAWIAWIREGFPQTTLVRMIQEGLLIVPAGDGDGDENVRAIALAEALRTVPIVAGRTRYAEQLTKAVAALQRRTEGRARADEDGQLLGDWRRALADTRRVLKLVADLLLITPDADTPPEEIILKTREFLTASAAVNEFEKYVKKSLLDEIDRVAKWFQPGIPSPTLDVWEWLIALTDIGVRGLGPQQGRLYIAPLHTGGHSGRKRTFIVGLDDGRFPGAPAQDPLLLDDERARISDDVPTAGKRLRAKTLAFERLLARLRGRVTLSYTGRALDDDREVFPSPYLLGAFRVLAGAPEGDLSAFERWLAAQGPPASFAPSVEAKCLDPGEWWLWRLCGDPPAGNAAPLVDASFPHLARGRRARVARGSDLFTPYDGLVPLAGAAYNPFAPDGPVLSSGRLETIGTCPRRYFLRYILEVEKPNYHEFDPAVWLDPMTAGSLLHDVFRRFMAGLKAEGLKPATPRDEGRMNAVLEEAIAAYRELYPEPSLSVLERQRRELAAAARTFLYEEADRCRKCEPAYFEVAIGLPAGEEPSSLDRPEPVTITLPGGGSFRARGRLDRVDREPDGSFAVWDYKTGGAGKYDRSSPFRGGRVIQNALYVLLLEAALARAGETQARVNGFGFFFPGVRGQGARIVYPAAALADGPHVIKLLCQLAAAGVFPPSDDAGDCTWCDYAEVCGLPAETCAGATVKLENDANEAMAPFRELRGAGNGG